MNDYNEVRIECTPCSGDITDLVADCLAEVGFESFEPDAFGVTAYIRATENPETIVKEALEDFVFDVKFEISSQLIEGEDWNAEWERNYFKPIIVGDECVVHSTFHTDIPAAKYDIVIDPKMAFGTGHHDTTSQMMQLILATPMEGKSVIDMGTGTGILAILCKMRGAATVTGIEIDQPAYVNAIEHSNLNGVDLALIHGDASALKSVEKADLFLANINRNIILNDLEHYVNSVKPGGELFFSGFYLEDVPMIVKRGEELGLKEIDHRSSADGWAVVRMSKP